MKELHPKGSPAGGEPVKAGAPDDLHHIGIVVPTIQSSIDGFMKGLQMEWDGVVFHDPIQTVRVTFLRHRSPFTPMIELVEPASADSRVIRFLKRGGGLHHLCYEVDSLSARLEMVMSAGAIILLEPTPAVAFCNRKIAWIYTPEKVLVEYLERSPASAEGDK